MIGSLNPERDALIFEESQKGLSNVKIARKYKLSAPRVNQIVYREKKAIELRNNKTSLYKLEERDKFISVFGTWVQKVSLLMPHLAALKALAEEKK